MTEPPGAGKPLDKLHVFFWILGILTAMGLALGFSFWVAHRRATATFKRHEQDVAARIAAIRARKKVPQSLIYGERIPGNGWPTLFRTLSGFKAIPKEDTNLVPRMAEDPNIAIDPTATEAVFAKYAGLVEELRRALRHEWSDAEYRLEEGYSLEVPHLGPSIHVARFLASMADHRHGKGEDDRAAEPVLLALGLAQDMGRNGFLVCFLVQIVCEGIAADAWKTVLKSHRLPARDLESFAACLDTLQGTRPDFFDSFVVEDPCLRLSLAQCGLKGLWLYGEDYLLKVGWRYFFSRKFVMADALPIIERFFKGIEGLRRLSPCQWEEESQRIRDEASRDKNPVVELLIPALVKAVQREKIARMNLALMRVATALAWYEAEKGAPPPALGDLVPRYLPKVPECPLTGKPFGYTPGKVWSFGVDGVDNGGKPTPEDQEEEPGYDVVWEVKRAPPSAAAPPPAPPPAK